MAMNRRLSGLLLCALAAGTCAPASALESSTSLRDELLHSTQAFLDAIPTGDKAVWERTLTNDAVIVDEFGRVSHKTDAIAALHPFPTGLSGSIELRDPQAYLHGDSAILEVEEYERETVFGQQLVVRYRSLLTFVKQAGAWKIAGYQESTIPTPPPRLAVADLSPADYAGTYRYAPSRAWTVSLAHGELSYTTRPGAQPNVLEPVAKDVFMSSDDERNLMIFRRDAHGKVDAMIERRKFNDLTLTRDP